MWLDLRGSRILKEEGGGGDLACWWEGSRVSGRLIWGLGDGKGGWMRGWLMVWLIDVWAWLRCHGILVRGFSGRVSDEPESWRQGFLIHMDM